MKLSEIFRSPIGTSSRTEGSFEYFVKLVIFEIAWLIISVAFFIFTKEYSIVIVSIAGAAGNAILISIGEKIYKLFTALAHLYVMAYVWFAVSLLGWGCGLQYLILSLVALGYFNPFNTRLVIDIINIAEILLFLYLLVTCYDITPDPSSAIYPYMSFLHVLSMTAACSFIIFAIRMTGLANSILNQQIQHRNVTLTTLANQDGLTGLHNRRSMQKILDASWQDFQKTKAPFFLATCDIDFLKAVNDTKGHEAGDLLIKTFADILLDAFKGEGAVSRWGGDEFLIIIQAPITKYEVMSLTQQARHTISKLDPEPFGLKAPPSLTIGVASSANKSSLSDMLLTIDNCLYEGKKRGRNKVIMEEEL